jgi:hypothetical protein
MTDIYVQATIIPGVRPHEMNAKFTTLNGIVTLIVPSTFVYNTHVKCELLDDQKLVDQTNPIGLVEVTCARGKKKLAMPATSCAFELNPSESPNSLSTFSARMRSLLDGRTLRMTSKKVDFWIEFRIQNEFLFTRSSINSSGFTQTSSGVHELLFNPDIVDWVVVQ